MKKFLFIPVLLLGLSNSGIAQNRSISFEESKEWNKIVEKAKAAKKLIFIDCYTDWCGPCKKLATTVFTQDNVADFYNANFVCAKFEMEKDKDGVMLKTKYGVSAFPTLLFIDPKTQQIAHRLVGAGSAEWLIEGGKTAKDPKANLNSMTERYKAGERDPQFIVAYTKVLGAAYMKDEQSKVTIDYLNSLSADQLATAENWILIRENLSDPLCKPMREVMTNRKKFYDIAGQDVVDMHLNNCIGTAAYAMAAWRPGEAPFNEARNTELTNYLETIDFPTAQALAYIKTADLARKGDWKGVLAKMRQVETDNVFKNDDYRYFQLNIESFTASKDKEVVGEAVAWLDKKIADTNNNYRKADYAQSKVRLLTSVGDALGADKAKMEEESYTRKGSDETGGRVQRAIRMN